VKRKTVNCNRCGKNNLVWATSKAGKYYLTDAESTAITNGNGRTIKTLQLAHQCLTPEQQATEAAFEDDCKRAQTILQALDQSFRQIMVILKAPEVDEVALQDLQQAREPLVAELENLRKKHNYNFHMETAQ